MYLLTKRTFPWIIPRCDLHCGSGCCNGAYLMLVIVINIIGIDSIVVSTILIYCVIIIICIIVVAIQS